MKYFFIIIIDKTPNDLERETTLLEQLVRLAEERNFAEFPPTGSGIPGKSISQKKNEIQFEFFFV
jgi:hypothetical protein